MIIASLWVGDKLTRLEKLSIQSFLNLGYEFHLFTYNFVNGVPENTIIKDANEIMPHEEIFELSSSFLPFSDIWRYKMLYEKGGYWVDLDMIAVRPFNFGHDEYVISSERTIKQGAFKSILDYVPNIGILKAPIHSPFYLELYNKCRDFNNTNQNHDKLKYMRIFRKMVKKYKYEKYIKPPNYFCPINWWNAKEAFLSLNEGESLPKKYGVTGCGRENIISQGDTYTCHFWRDRATTKYGMDLNLVYPNSIYESVVEFNGDYII